MIRTCGRCGRRVHLIAWGIGFKWVSGKDTWKCDPTAESPVRSHYPVAVDKPVKKEFCPACQQPMKWFGDHWLCTSIKVHDNAKVSADSHRGESQPRGESSGGFMGS